MPIIRVVALDHIRSDVYGNKDDSETCPVPEDEGGETHQEVLKENKTPADGIHLPPGLKASHVHDRKGKLQQKFDQILKAFKVQYCQ
jgi:hypothetical protein